MAVNVTKSKFIHRAWQAALGLTGGAVLLGCVGSAAKAPIADTAGDKTETAFNADSFTSDGKPTKTIETPWGLREVYDPTQDEQVRAAFKRIYDKDEGVRHIESYTSRLEVYVNPNPYQNPPVSLPRKKLESRQPTHDDLLLHQALKDRRLNYKNCNAIGWKRVIAYMYKAII